MTTCLTTASVGGAPLSPAPMHAARTTFDAPALASLRSGQAVFGPDDTAYVLIFAPVDHVWRLLVDIEHWPVIWGDMESVKSLGKAGKYEEYSFVTKSPVGKKQYTLVFTVAGMHRLEWFLDKTQPADFRDTRGFWKLEPFDGGSATLVVYRGEYDAWWFPAVLQKRLASSVVTGLRRFVDQHPHQVAGK